MTSETMPSRARPRPLTRFGRAWVLKTVFGREGLGRLLAVAALGLMSCVPAQAASQTVRVVEYTETSHPWVTWQCARLPVQVRQLGRNLEVRVGGESRWLIPARSASGARFVVPGDDTTEFWGKGPRARLTWSGQALPECTEPGAITLPFRASGNEPFWAVHYDGWRLQLSRLGHADYEVDAVVVQQESVVDALQGNGPSGPVRVALREQLCTDSMAGLVRPYAVTASFQEDVLHGCGGDAARLLQGARWDVRKAEGTQFSAPAWLEFLPNGQLRGVAGLNRLTGNYRVTGEGIQLGGLAATRKACPAPVAEQEAALLAVLPEVRGFSFDEDGKLVMHAYPDRRVILQMHAGQ